MEPQSGPPGTPNSINTAALNSLSLDRNDTLTRSGKVQGSLARRTSGFDGAKAAFWKETLQGKAPELGLPADKPKKSTPKSSGAQQVPFTIPAELSNNLGHVSAQLQADLHDVLLAAFSVLLVRYSRQDDITLGCALPCGNHQAQLLPVRLDLAEDPPFNKLLSKAQGAVTAAGKHAGLRLEQVVEAAGGHMPPGRSVSSHPLYQAAFLMRPHGQQHADDVHEELERFMLDILLEVNPGSSELDCKLLFNQALFNEDTIQRMSRHLVVLLSSIVQQPQARLSELVFIDDQERHHVLEGLNQTDKRLPPFCAGKTMHQIFEHWAAEGPDRPCLIYEGQQLSYGEANARANQLAHHLIALGVTPGSSVGVMMERSFELFIGIFAVLKAGAAYIPMDPEYPADRLMIMAEDSEAPVLLTQRHVQERVKLKVQAKVVMADAEWQQIAGQPTSSPGVPADPKRLMYMIFTSGSTGRPKGTMLEGAGLVNFVNWMVGTENLGPDDIFIQKTPISFDASMREIFPPFFCGARLVIAPPGMQRDTQGLIRIITEQRVTCTSWVPSQLEIFAQETGEGQCQQVRASYTGGEALPMSTAQNFHERLPQSRLHNLYGPTEATVDVTGFDTSQKMNRSVVPIGRPIDNVRMYVLDAKMKPLPVGVPGELMISSHQVARGYLKRPDENAKTFVDNPYGQGDYARMYRTGDLARWLPDGNIEFLGRIDSQVKLRGFRIELGEIENVLSRCKNVQLAVVKLTKDSAGTDHLVAYLTPSSVDVEAVKSQTAESVPAYMVPEIVMPLDELPRLPNGKINRRGLPEPDFSNRDQSDFAEPKGEAEQRIQEIWQEVLQQQPISRTADFFQIGGNSLLAGKVMSRINSAFGSSGGFTMIFEARTIAGIAEQVAGGSQDAGNGSLGRPSSAKDRSVDAGSIPASHDEASLESGVPASYSQEMLIFNNELDPFNPAHNEPFWVKINGSLSVEALYTAFLFLADRHSLMRSHFELENVAGPQICAQPIKHFQLPFSYTDLSSGKDLLDAGIAERAHAALPLHARPASNSFMGQIRRNAPGHSRPSNAAPADGQVEAPQKTGMLQGITSHMPSLPSLPNPFKRNSNSAPAETSPPPSRGSASGSISRLHPRKTGSFDHVAPEELPTAHGAAVASFSMPSVPSQPSDPAMQRDGLAAIADVDHAESESESHESSSAHQILDIRSRVKKALAKHYLTLGLYSKYKSGGKTGLGNAVRQRLQRQSTPEPLDTLADEVGLERQSNAVEERSSPAMDMPELVQQGSPEALQLREAMQACTCRKFDMSKGPLFHVDVFRLSDGSHVMLMTLHHSITDGWSTSIICKELSAAYNSFNAHQHPTLDPLPCQYGDFSTWQRNWLQSGKMDAQLKYWGRKMRGAAPLWDFPCDYPRPNVPSSDGARVPVELSGDVLQVVQTLMKRTNSTMFMTLLAAFQLLLGRYCGGCDDIIVGAPFAGRTRSEAEVLIGAFVGAVAIRTDLSGEPNFQQLMKRVRATALEAFENADTPFHLVILEAGDGSPGEGGASFSPLFQSMFFLHDESWSEGLSLDQCECEPLHNVEKSVARFDLTLELTVMRGGKSVEGHLEYNEDLFSRETAVRLITSLQVLLSSVAQLPDTSVWKLPIVTEAERQQQQQFRLSPQLAEQLPQGLQVQLGSPLLLLDSNLQPLPLAVLGELYIGSMHGQQGDLQRTGVLARFMPDGQIELHGHAGNRVVVNHFTIQLEEVEELVCRASSQVQDAAVAVYMDESTGKDLLVAFVAPASVNVQALDLAFRRSFPLYMVPSIYQPVSSIPHLPNRQVLRDSLPQPDWDHQPVRQYKAPRDSLEIEVQLIWQAVIGLDRISIDDDFSSIGGNMLHAVIINAIFRQVLGVTVPALDIFRERTIAGLAKTIARAREEQQKPGGRLALIRQKATSRLKRGRHKTTQ